MSDWQGDSELPPKSASRASAPGAAPRDPERTLASTAAASELRCTTRMQSPYRDSSWALTDHEECRCSHACSACRARIAKLAREAGAARARRRLTAIAVLAIGGLLGVFSYESVGLTSAIERLTEATGEASIVALRSPPVPAVATAAKFRPPPDASPAVVRSAPLWPAIIRESDTVYLIDRRLIDVVLEEQASLMRSVRVVPSFVDGKTYPRLLGVRPDSLLGLLGFRDGDCLESINGFDLTTPDRALEAYAHLRTSDSLEATVRRRGQTVTLRYRVW